MEIKTKKSGNNYTAHTCRSLSLTPAATETKSFFFESRGLNCNTTSLTAKPNKVQKEYVIPKITYQCLRNFGSKKSTLIFN